MTFPAPSVTFDLVILGAGSAGLSAARFARDLGATVALVDQTRPGGDCLFSGCIPSKTLLKVAKVAWEARRAERYGLSVGALSIDVAAIRRHVEATIERVYDDERPEALAANGIAFFSGGARFVGPNAVQAGEQVLRGGRFLICTGARPRRPPIPGLANVSYLTYDDALRLDTLPASTIVLGTGPVGVELAQAYCRLGSRVTVIGRSGHLLRSADPAVQSLIADILRDEGIDLRLAMGVESIGSGYGGRVEVRSAEATVIGDALLVAVGRTPNVENLGLDLAGVVYSTNGVTVDESLRTSNPAIYACGDVVGGAQFSHYAAWQGYIAVRNALLPGTSRGIQENVPWAMFTDPEVAMVGMTEPEARQRHGKEIAVSSLSLDHVDRARTDDAVRGFVKVVHRRNGQILGAHIVADRAGEMINEYVVAMRHRIPLDRLAQAIHVYPTYSTATQQVAVSFFTRKLLSGFKGRLLRALVRHSG